MLFILRLYVIMLLSFIQGLFLYYSPSSALHVSLHFILLGSYG